MRNKFEKAVDLQLKKAKVKYDYEAEWLAYTLELRYLPDFVLRTDPPVYVECKGWLRPEDKQKLLAVRRQHLGIDLRILFQTNNKKQVRWAEKNKFIYAIGTIPEDWLMTKHPQNRWERRQLNEKKHKKNQDIRRKREGSDSPVPNDVGDNKEF